MLVKGITDKIFNRIAEWIGRSKRKSGHLKESQ